MIKKISIIFLVLLSSCKKDLTIKGNWAWITNDNKYFEVFIDSISIVGYRHSFLERREYKIAGDIFFLDKIEKGYYLSYKLKLINENKLLLINKDRNEIRLIKLNNDDFTIDCIKSNKDKDKFELEYSTREEKWLNK